MRTDKFARAMPYLINGPKNKIFISTIESFLEFINHYKIGDYIYADALKRNLKMSSYVITTIMTTLFEKGYVGKIMGIHCPACGHLMKPESPSSSEIICPQCDTISYFSNGFEIYKILKIYDGLEYIYDDKREIHYLIDKDNKAIAGIYYYNLKNILDTKYSIRVEDCLINDGGLCCLYALAICRPEDEWNENFGIELVNRKISAKIHKKTIKYIKKIVKQYNNDLCKLLDIEYRNNVSLCNITKNIREYYNGTEEDRQRMRKKN